jgi:hypothetical protein
MISHLTRARSLLLYRLIPLRTPVYTRKFGNMTASILKLASPLKDLVLGATPELGKSDQDKAEVAGWIEKVVQGDIVKPTSVKVCI